VDKRCIMVSGGKSQVLGSATQASSWPLIIRRKTSYGFSSCLYSSIVMDVTENAPPEDEDEEDLEVELDELEDLVEVVEVEDLVEVVEVVLEDETEVLVPPQVNGRGPRMESLFVPTGMRDLTYQESHQLRSRANLLMTSTYEVGEVDEVRLERKRFIKDTCLTVIPGSDPTREFQNMKSREPILLLTSIGTREGDGGRGCASTAVNARCHIEGRRTRISSGTMQSDQFNTEEVVCDWSASRLIKMANDLLPGAMQLGMVKEVLPPFASMVSTAQVPSE
ncbi:6332_t:CDS:2, partial [Acaulospora colombiana]